MWAELQTRIVAKLRADLPATYKVNTAADVAQVTDKAQITPGVIVVYAGFSKADEPANADSKKALVQLNFFVIALARIARGSGTTDAAAEAAAEICDEIIGSLLGYDLGTTDTNKRGTGQFCRLETPLPPEYDGGYCMAPLAFSVRKTVKSNTVT